MKLGEVLIAEGLITASQLKDALDAQLIYGGHLGTCLIELGCVSEERLGQALARSFGVPYAPFSAFLDIPRYVVNALPSTIVQKHATVPLRLKDKILDVAMIDPKNAQAIDELRFVSGYTIRTSIAPEVRIFQAQERYYDLPRRIRYVTLCRTLDKSHPAPARAPFEGSDPREGGRAAEVRSHAAAATAVLEAAAPRAASQAVGSAVADPLAGVSDRFCTATTEDQVADLVLGAMHGNARRRILFKVQGGSAYVWRSAGAEIDQNAVSHVRFPILSEPVFGLLNGDDYYAGPLPSDPLNLGFYRKLGIETPRQILLLPVHNDDQLIALFYGDCGRMGTIGPDVESHRRLLAKAALAIDVLQTKRRIHAI